MILMIYDLNRYKNVKLKTPMILFRRRNHRSIYCSLVLDKFNFFFFYWFYPYLIFVFNISEIIWMKHFWQWPNGELFGFLQSCYFYVDNNISYWASVFLVDNSTEIMIMKKHWNLFCTSIKTLPGIWWFCFRLYMGKWASASKGKQTRIISHRRKIAHPMGNLMAGHD